jgi:hypothetical protein
MADMKKIRGGRFRRHAQTRHRAMTDDRWKDFFDKMAGTGLVNPRTNYKRAYTL